MSDRTHTGLASGRLSRTRKSPTPHTTVVPIPLCVRDRTSSNTGRRRNIYQYTSSCATPPPSPYTDTSSVDTVYRSLERDSGPEG